MTPSSGGLASVRASSDGIWALHVSEADIERSSSGESISLPKWRACVVGWAAYLVVCVVYTALRCHVGDRGGRYGGGV